TVTRFTPAVVRSLGLDELQAELTDGLGVDLADARCGPAEDLADLGEGEALEVVKRDDDLLAFGQRVDRRCEEPTRLLPLEPCCPVGASIGGRAQPRHLLA